MKRLIDRIRPFRWSTFLGSVLVFIFLVVAGAVLWRDGRELRQQIVEVDYGLLILSFVVEVAGWLLAVFVWQRIVRHLGIGIRWREHLRIYAYSMLGIALPGRIWAIAGRVTLYERQGASKLSILTASVVEYLLIGLSSLLVFGLVTVFSGDTLVWERPVVAIFSTLAALLLVQPPLFNRLVAWLLRRSAQMDKPTPRPMHFHDLALWLLLESIVVVVGGTAVYILLHSLIPSPADIFLTILSAWAAAAVAGNLFFWIPGPVIRDSFMITILSQAMPAPMAILFVLIVRVWTIGSIFLLVGLVWLTTKTAPMLTRLQAKTSRLPL